MGFSGVDVAYAEKMKVSPKVIRTAGGALKLQKLSPEVQRLLLGKSK